jgi:hypothetical protein
MAGSVYYYHLFELSLLDLFGHGSRTLMTFETLGGVKVSTAFLVKLKHYVVGRCRFSVSDISEN